MNGLLESLLEIAKRVCCALVLILFAAQGGTFIWFGCQFFDAELWPMLFVIGLPLIFGGLWMMASLLLAAWMIVLQGFDF